MPQKLQPLSNDRHNEFEPNDDPAGMFGIVSGVAFGVISGFFIAGAVSLSAAGFVALFTGLVLGWKAAGRWRED